MPLHNSESITVSCPSDGGLSVESADTDICTASLSGTALVLTAGESTGTTTVTISGEAGTNHNKPQDKTIQVTVAYAS